MHSYNYATSSVPLINLCIPPPVSLQLEFLDAKFLVPRRCTRFWMPRDKALCRQHTCAHLFWDIRCPLETTPVSTPRGGIFKTLQCTCLRFSLQSYPGIIVSF